MKRSNIKLVLGVASTCVAMALNASTVHAGQHQDGPTSQAQEGQLNRKDYNFLVQAAHTDLEEVQAGQIAKQRGTSQAVHSFGDHMINDHSKVNAGLKEIAAQKGANVPTELAQEQAATLQHLKGLSGSDFDKTFAQDMVKGHTGAVKEFQEAAKDLSDTDLRAWAQTTLPLLQEHLRMAKNMEATVHIEK